MISKFEWSESRLDLVRSQYPTSKPVEEIAEELGCTPQVLRYKAKKLGISRPISNKKMCKHTSQGKWTVQEKEFLVAELKEAPDILRIAVSLGRTEHAVRMKAQKLGLKTGYYASKVRWTADHDAYLKAHLYTKSYNEFASELGFSATKIRHKILRLDANRRAAHRWPLEDLNTLRELYGKMPLLELCELLGRSKTQVYGMAQSENLVRHNNKYTTPETEVRLALETLGIEFTEQLKFYTGERGGKNQRRYFRPDFYLPKLNAVIEVHGDFYHCHPVLYPNPKYSLQRKNIQRDMKKHRFFTSRGIMFHVIWQADCDDRQKLLNHLKNISAEVKPL